MEVNASAEGYEPPTEFKQTDEDPLFGISVTDSTELWLIQLPPKQFKPAEFDGKEVKLKLHGDGRLGSLENVAGKSFDIVSSGNHQSNATVFLAGSSATRAVGKISRRVSLVSFEADAETHGKARGGRSSLMNWSSGGSSNRVGSHGNTALTNSRRSSLGISGTSFEGGEASELPKQRRVDRSPSSQHSKPTMKGSRSPGSLNTSQRSSQVRVKHHLKVNHQNPGNKGMLTGRPLLKTQSAVGVRAKVGAPMSYQGLNLSPSRRTNQKEDEM